MTSSAKQQPQQFTLKSKQQFKLYKKNKTTTYNQFSKSQFTSVKLKALKYLAAQETKVCQL